MGTRHLRSSFRCSSRVPPLRQGDLRMCSAAYGHGTTHAPTDVLPPRQEPLLADRLGARWFAEGVTADDTPARARSERNGPEPQAIDSDSHHRNVRQAERASDWLMRSRM